MPSPASNVTTLGNSNFGYSLNGTPHISGSYTSSKYWDIHPASGNADMLKGFRLCRAWDRTWGNLTIVESKPIGYKARAYNGGGQDLWVCSNGVDGWVGPASGVNTNPIAGLPDLPSSNMLNATLVAALEKLKAQDIHVGNFIAEGDKTLEMVGNTIHRIARGVKNFRVSNPQLWKEVVSTQTGNLPREKWCTIPSAWLELQYGWKPLMSDVYGALHHLSRSDRYQVPYVTVRSHRHADEIFSQTLNLDTTFWGGATGGCIMSYDDSKDVWVQLVYGVKTPQLAELSSLGLVNPLEVLWEITPYSFVVDWFLPISSWLSSLTGALGYEFITGSQSSKSVRKFRSCKQIGQRLTPVNVGFAYDYYRYPGDLTVKGEAGVFRRTCYSGSPVPGIYVKNPLSLDHVANGLSLLVQLFR